MIGSPLEEHGEVFCQQHVLAKADLAACELPPVSCAAQHVMALAGEVVLLAFATAAP